MAAWSEFNEDRNNLPLNSAKPLMDPNVSPSLKSAKKLFTGPPTN